MIDDLDKYSRYHNFSNPNSYKQAAYLMHWVSRLKPIPLSFGTNPNTHKCNHPLLHTDKYGLANEVFAVQLGFARVGIDYSRLRLSAKYRKIVHELIYQLYYRQVNPKQLYITLEALHIAIQSDPDPSD
jgi:hypothetical protein